MARRKEGILEILMVLPWWFSVIVSALAYGLLTVFIPAVAVSNANAGVRGVLTGLSDAAPWVAIVLLVPAPVSTLNAWRKRRLLDSQKGIDSIRALSWRQFEELVAEGHRRLGYTVLENHRLGADGGVDVRLKKDGEVTLVQCKQWKAQKVGVSVVREMLGLVTAEGAARGIVICSGRFTAEARAFARGKPIELVDGSRLAALIGSVQKGAAYSEEPTTPMTDIASDSPGARVNLCPQCGGRLLLRTAKRGGNAGSQFWGCASYPTCRYTKGL